MNPLEQLPIPLLEWFRDNARSLPWRDDPTPYHVWLSEIMLQQTRVAAVLDYYRRFLAQAPDVPALAALPEERLMKLWQGLGYYSRARNLQRAAQVIVEQYGGVFPADYGNVLRVYARIMGDDGDITAPQMKQKVTQAVGEIIPLNAAGTFNQALMELGATVCLPNGAPLCERCPAKGFCAALGQGRIGELPVKAPKKARRVEKRAVWLIFWENRVALRRRPDRGLLAGLWEFPNEMFGGQGPEQWGIDAELQEWGSLAKHIFTHIEWHMSILPAEAKGPTLPPGWVWASARELKELYPVPSAFEGALRLVHKRMECVP